MDIPDSRLTTCWLFYRSRYSSSPVCLFVTSLYYLFKLLCSGISGDLDLAITDLPVQSSCRCSIWLLQPRSRVPVDQTHHCQHIACLHDPILTAVPARYVILVDATVC